MPNPNDYPVTAETVAAAKAARDAELAELMRRVPGIIVDEEGYVYIIDPKRTVH
jgi:hypothetical protein